MLRSYNSQQSSKLRPQEDLENISFYWTAKSSDALTNKKVNYFMGEQQFSSWDDKDDDRFMRFSYYHQQQQCITNSHMKKRPEMGFKRTANDKVRLTNSVLLETKKIDLGAKASESIKKYNLIANNKTYYSPRKNLPLPQAEHHHQQNSIRQSTKSAMIKQFSRDELLKSRARMLQQKNESLGHKRQLSQRVCYNIISYPVQTSLTKRRKLRRFQRFPFPMLTARFCK